MCILRPGDSWDSWTGYPGMLHIGQGPRSAVIVAYGKRGDEILLNYEFTTTSNVWVWRSMRLIIGGGFETKWLSMSRSRATPFGLMSFTSSFRPAEW